MNRDCNPKIIIGLGNPAPQYEKTYHNAGFLFVDYLLQNKEFLPAPKIIKSKKYMNESGKFVKEILKKTGIKPQNLLVLHDDADIEIGKYKLSFGKNSGGHKGVEDIIKSLKTKNFWRLRIGIRKPEINSSASPVSKTGESRQKPKARIKAENFVLKKISGSDLKILSSVFKKAADLLKSKG